jgi:hypothetical protein
MRRSLCRSLALLATQKQNSYPPGQARQIATDTLKFRLGFHASLSVDICRFEELLLRLDLALQPTHLQHGTLQAVLRIDERSQEIALWHKFRGWRRRGWCRFWLLSCTGRLCGGSQAFYVSTVIQLSA